MPRIDSRTMRRYLVVAAAAPLLLGCNRSLTRGDAAALIRQANGLPQDEMMQFESSQSGGGVRYEHWPNSQYDRPHGPSPMPALFSQLENDGFVTIRLTADTTENWRETYGRFAMISIRYRYEAAWTPKASPYVLNGMIKVSKLDLGEVTGIVEAPEQKATRVEYTVHRTLTPLGTAFGVSSGPEARSAMFTRYDDGWRLTAGR